MESKTLTTTDVITDVQPIVECQTIVEAPLFIIFAEYLGYVSMFNKMAEEWCDGKVPDIHVQKIIILEANCILRQMKKDYEISDIHEFYEMYYPYILKEYDDNLTKLIKKN